MKRFITGPSFEYCYKLRPDFIVSMVTTTPAIEFVSPSGAVLLHYVDSAKSLHGQPPDSELWVVLSSRALDHVLECETLAEKRGWTIKYFNKPADRAAAETAHPQRELLIQQIDTKRTLLQEKAAYDRLLQARVEYDRVTRAQQGAAEKREMEGEASILRSMYMDAKAVLGSAKAVLGAKK